MTLDTAGYTIDLAGLDTGSGSLTVTGTGTMIESGPDLHTGGTTISAGATVIVRCPCLTLGSNSPDVVNNGTLIFDDSAPPGSDGSANISGSGRVIVTGPYTTVFTGNNTYTGGTIIEGGTLQIGDPLSTTAGSLPGNVVIESGATLEFAGALSHLVTGDITGGGHILLAFNPPSGISKPLLVTGNILSTGQITDFGTIQVGDGGLSGSIASANVQVWGNAHFIIDRAGTMTYSGAFTGIGDVSFTGPATIILTGTSQLGGGRVFIEGGTLQFGDGGSSGGINGAHIYDDGTLVFDRSDTFQFQDLITGSGGIVQEGSGTTISDYIVGVTGKNYVTAGTLEVGAEPANELSELEGSTDVLGGRLIGYGIMDGPLHNIAGTVSPGVPGGPVGTMMVYGSYKQERAGTLEVGVEGATNYSLTAFDSTASLDGKLSLVFDHPAGGYQSYTILTAGSVNGTFSSVTQSGLTQGTAVGVLYGPTTVSVVTVPEDSAQAYGAGWRNQFDAMETLNDRLFTHLGSGHCTASAPDPSDSDVWNCDAFQTWLQVDGGGDGVEGGGGQSGYNARWLSVLGGVEYRPMPGIAVGVAAAFDNSEVAVRGAGGHAGTNSIAVALTGAASLFDGTVDAAVIYALNNGRTSHMVQSQTVSAPTKGHGAGVSVQYSQSVQDPDLKAFVRLSYDGVSQDAIRESGVAPFDLAIAAQDGRSFYGDAGLVFAPSYDVGSDFRLIPQAGVGVRDRFTQPGTVEATLVDAGGATFAVPVARRLPLELTLDLGLTLATPEGDTVFVRVLGAGNSQERHGTISIGGSIAF